MISLDLSPTWLICSYNVFLAMCCNWAKFFGSSQLFNLIGILICDDTLRQLNNLNASLSFNAFKGIYLFLQKWHGRYGVFVTLHSTGRRFRYDSKFWSK